MRIGSGRPVHQGQGDFQALGREKDFHPSGKGREPVREIRADDTPIFPGGGCWRHGPGPGQHDGQVGQGKARHARPPAEQPGVAAKEQAQAESGGQHRVHIPPGGLQGRVCEKDRLLCRFPGRYGGWKRGPVSGEVAEQMGQPGIGRRGIRCFQMGVGQDVAPPAKAAGHDAGATGEEGRGQAQAEAFLAGGEHRLGHGAEMDVGQPEIGFGPGIGGQHRHVPGGGLVRRGHESGRPPDRRGQMWSFQGRDQGRVAVHGQAHMAADQMVQALAKGSPHPGAKAQAVGMGQGQAGPAADAEVGAPVGDIVPDGGHTLGAQGGELAPGKAAGHEQGRRLGPAREDAVGHRGAGNRGERHAQGGKTPAQKQAPQLGMVPQDEKRRGHVPC